MVEEERPSEAAAAAAPTTQLPLLDKDHLEEHSPARSPPRIAMRTANSWIKPKFQLDQAKIDQLRENDSEDQLQNLADWMEISQAVGWSFAEQLGSPDGLRPVLIEQVAALGNEDIQQILPALQVYEQIGGVWKTRPIKFLEKDMLQDLICICKRVFPDSVVRFGGHGSSGDRRLERQATADEALDRSLAAHTRIDTMGHPRPEEAPLPPITRRPAPPLPAPLNALDRFSKGIPDRADTRSPRRPASSRRRSRSRGGKKSKKKRAASSSGSSSDGDAHRYREWLDQNQAGTFHELSEDAIWDAELRWAYLHHGLTLPENIRPVPEQWSAVAARFDKKSSKVLFEDSGIFRPAMAEARAAMEAMGLPGSKLPDGKRRGRYQGVQTFPQWLRYWGIRSSTEEGLDITSPAVNVEYQMNFAELNALWNKENKFWWICAAADHKMRTVQFKTWLRQMRRSQDPALRGESFRNGDRRMEALYERGARDEKFWNKELIQMVLAAQAGLLKKSDTTDNDFGIIAWSAIPVPLKDPSLPIQSKPPVQTVIPPAQFQVLSKSQKRNARKRERQWDLKSQAGQGADQQEDSSSTKGFGKGLDKQGGRGGKQGQFQGQGQKGQQQQLQNQWQNTQADGSKGLGNKGRGKGQVKNGGRCLQWTQKGSCTRGQNCPWKHE